MKISVHAVRELEYALKAAADEAMMEGRHEVDASALMRSNGWTTFATELAQAQKTARDAKG